MAGDADNVNVWQGADVYINDTVAAAGPTDLTTAWAAGWNAVGLLDGAEGFATGREDEVKEHYAWGGVLVKTTKSKHKRTIKFVCMEDNATTFKLVNPGSPTPTTASGVTTSIIKVPTNVEFAIGFEVRDGDDVKRRIVERASVLEVGEIKESEEEPTVYEVTVVIYPNEDSELYTELSGTV